jgi:hypothetical protein
MQGSAHDHVANAETTLQQQIRLALGTHPDTKLFRNQVGSLPDPRTGISAYFVIKSGNCQTHAPAGLFSSVLHAAVLT